MNVLITGVLGMVGSHMLDFLLETLSGKEITLPS